MCNLEPSKLASNEVIGRSTSSNPAPNTPTPQRIKTLWWLLGMVSPNDFDSGIGGKSSAPQWIFNWVVVSNIFYFHPYLGKWSNLTNIFQMGWFNHQPVKDFSSFFPLILASAITDRMSFVEYTCCLMAFCARRKPKENPAQIQVLACFSPWLVEYFFLVEIALRRPHCFQCCCEILFNCTQLLGNQPFQKFLLRIDRTYWTWLVWNIILRESHLDITSESSRGILARLSSWEFFWTWNQKSDQISSRPHTTDFPQMV